MKPVQTHFSQKWRLSPFSTDPFNYKWLWRANPGRFTDPGYSIPLACVRDKVIGSLCLSVIGQCTTAMHKLFFYSLNQKPILQYCLTLAMNATNHASLSATATHFLHSQKLSKA